MLSKINKTDPRVVRTRQLIQNAFISLSKEKDFDTITVRDITERATINRATFYSHYSDKYVLIESIISDSFMSFVSKRIPPQASATEETMRSLILSVLDYCDSLCNSCKSGYKSFGPIAQIKVKELLQNIIVSLLTNNISSTDEEKLSIYLLATMISCSICGAIYSMRKKYQLTMSANFTEEILHFIMAGGYGERCQDIKN